MSIGGHEPKTTRWPFLRLIGFLHYTPHNHRQQQHEQDSSSRNHPVNPRASARPDNLLNFHAQLRRSDVQSPTLAYGVQKLQFLCKNRSTRFPIRHVCLDGCTLSSLQLIVQIQRQPPSYVVTLTQLLPSLVNP